tara:strand:- start:831 stop:1334 length:504 start_codon:yes stop_codon:yes gene_type:complete
MTEDYKQPLNLDCFEHNRWQLSAILGSFINGYLGYKYHKCRTGHSHFDKGSDCDLTHIKQYTESSIEVEETEGTIHCEPGDMHIVFANIYQPSRYHHMDCFPGGVSNDVVLNIWIKKGQNLFDCIYEAVDEIDWIPDEGEGQEYRHNKFYGEGFKKHDEGEIHFDFT